MTNNLKQDLQDLHNRLVANYNDNVPFEQLEEDRLVVSIVIDLIDQYEAEIESLKDTLLRECQAHNEYIFNTMVENKMLEEAKNAYKDIVDTCEIGAIKEFAEKIFKEITSAILSNADVIDERVQKRNADRYEDDICIMCDGKIRALGGIEYFIKNLLKEMGVE